MLVTKYIECFILKCIPVMHVVNIESFVVYNDIFDIYFYIHELYCSYNIL